MNFELDFKKFFVGPYNKKEKENKRYLRLLVFKFNVRTNINQLVIDQKLEGKKTQQQNNNRVKTLALFSCFER